MRHALAALLLLSAPAAVGCSPRLIPGTEIKDTPDSHQILDVVGAYQKALERRDIDKIVRLTSPTFFETSGTADTKDDYDRAGLETKLRTWLEKTRSVRVNDFTVKTITVEGDSAKVQYFFDVSYQIVGPDNVPQWKHDSDTKEMMLKREAGMWRITGGI